MQPDERELKSYVWHDKKCFFVSTILRTSSAMINDPPRYYETIAWDFDWDKNEKGKLIAMGGQGGAFKQHFNVCKQLYERGQFLEEE